MPIILMKILPVTNLITNHTFYASTTKFDENTFPNELFHHIAKSRTFQHAHALFLMIQLGQ